jgi:hypothetical protein|tara:strand:- start:390 stop:620 length:231 start_codon:yes stop_codon:yes gene_type:complete
VKIGDLVRYNQEYASGDTSVGIIVQVHIWEPDSLSTGHDRLCNAPYRVRWAEDSPTLRSWYMEEELEVLNKHKGND